MNSASLKILIRFLLLIPLQVLIANHMRLFGYINPQICLLFILWYPLKKDVFNFLIVSFIFGIIIDLFSNSGGINSASCLLLAYVRLPLLKFILNERDLDIKLFKYSNYNTFPKIVLIFSFAFIHQLTIYFLEYFDTTYTFTILYKTFTNSLFTTFVVIIFLSIFTSSKKQ